MYHPETKAKQHEGVLVLTQKQKLNSMEVFLILMCTNISAVCWQDPILGIASVDKGEHQTF